jgi:phosphoribosylanthranilate isomerase
VSSGIETAPGEKDPEKMRRFVDAVRIADTRG